MITCRFENGNQNNLRHVTAACLVIKDSELLLAKRSRGLSEAGKWCLVGGYANRGETIQQAAAREAQEETGYSVGHLQLLHINDSPDRPGEDKQNVDFIFIAQALELVGQKDWESEEVRWFPLDDLPPEDQIAFDHADYIRFYKRHLAALDPLPVIGALKTC